MEKYTDAWYDQFDTVITLTAYCTGSEFAALQARAYELCGRYYGLFNIYGDYAEPNLKTVNDNAGLPVEVDAEITALLKLCKEAYAATDGAVNVCMGSVLGIWHAFREAGIANPDSAELPPAQELTRAAAHCDIDDLIINEAEGTVELIDPGMRLDVGAAAKGYAAGRIAETLRAEGYTSFLLSLGGNVVAVGTKPGGEEWTVGVQDPETTAVNIATRKLSDASMVTSGDYQRYYTVNGVRYCHIIDPATLMPVRNYASVTVMCADSAWGDILSTALFIIPQQEGEALLKKYNAEGMWVYHDGTTYATSGF